MSKKKRWVALGGGVFSGADLDLQICRVYTEQSRKRRITVKERNANARLIAAAPELLEALKGCLPSLVNAEYRLRVNDWAEGDPNENDDTTEDGVRAYRLVLKNMQTAIKLAARAIVKVEGKEE